MSATDSGLGLGKHHTFSDWGPLRFSFYLSSKFPPYFHMANAVQAADVSRTGIGDID
jgi:hypothetical protein